MQTLGETRLLAVLTADENREPTPGVAHASHLRQGGSGCLWSAAFDGQLLVRTVTLTIEAPGDGDAMGGVDGILLRGYEGVSAAPTAPPPPVAAAATAAAAAPAAPDETSPPPLSPSDSTEASPLVVAGWHLLPWGQHRGGAAQREVAGVDNTPAWRAHWSWTALLYFIGAAATAAATSPHLKPYLDRDGAAHDIAVEVERVEAYQARTRDAAGRRRTWELAQLRLRLTALLPSPELDLDDLESALVYARSVGLPRANMARALRKVGLAIWIQGIARRRRILAMQLKQAAAAAAVPMDADRASLADAMTHAAHAVPMGTAADRLQSTAGGTLAAALVRASTRLCQAERAQGGVHRVRRLISGSIDASFEVICTRASPPLMVGSSAEKLRQKLHEAILRRAVAAALEHAGVTLDDVEVLLTPAPHTPPRASGSSADIGTPTSTDSLDSPMTTTPTDNMGPYAASPADSDSDVTPLLLTTRTSDLEARYGRMETVIEESAADATNAMAEMTDDDEEATAAAARLSMGSATSSASNQQPGVCPSLATSGSAATAWIMSATAIGQGVADKASVALTTFKGAVASAAQRLAPAAVACLRWAAAHANAAAQKTSAIAIACSRDVLRAAAPLAEACAASATKWAAAVAAWAAMAAASAAAWAASVATWASPQAVAAMEVAAAHVERGATMAMLSTSSAATDTAAWIAARLAFISGWVQVQIGRVLSAEHHASRTRSHSSGPASPPPSPPSASTSPPPPPGGQRYDVYVSIVLPAIEDSVLSVEEWLAQSCDALSTDLGRHLRHSHLELHVCAGALCVRQPAASMIDVHVDELNEAIRALASLPSFSECDVGRHLVISDDGSMTVDGVPRHVRWEADDGQKSSRDYARWPPPLSSAIVDVDEVVGGRVATADGHQLANPAAADADVPAELYEPYLRYLAVAEVVQPSFHALHTLVERSKCTSAENMAHSGQSDSDSSATVTALELRPAVSEARAAQRAALDRLRSTWTWGSWGPDGDGGAGGGNGGGDGERDEVGTGDDARDGVEVGDGVSVSSSEQGNRRGGGGRGGGESQLGQATDPLLQSVASSLSLKLRVGAAQLCAVAERELLTAMGATPDMARRWSASGESLPRRVMFEPEYARTDLQALACARARAALAGVDASILAAADEHMRHAAEAAGHTPTQLALMEMVAAVDGGEMYLDVQSLRRAIECARGACATGMADTHASVADAPGAAASVGGFEVPHGAQSNPQGSELLAQGEALLSAATRALEHAEAAQALRDAAATATCALDLPLGRVGRALHSARAIGVDATLLEPFTSRLEAAKAAQSTLVHQVHTHLDRRLCRLMERGARAVRKRLAADRLSGKWNYHDMLLAVDTESLAGGLLATTRATRGACARHPTSGEEPSVPSGQAEGLIGHGSTYGSTASISLMLAPYEHALQLARTVQEMREMATGRLLAAVAPIRLDAEHLSVEKLLCIDCAALHAAYQLAGEARVDGVHTARAQRVLAQALRVQRLPPSPDEADNLHDGHVQA